jgi:hypothetical protein
MFKIISRKKVIILTLMMFLIFMIIGICIGKRLTYESKNIICYSPETRQTMYKGGQNNIPLPKSSDITTEKNNYRLDLEKISINKYFIIYSVIYGDQSHTAYHLYLTNLAKEKIDKSKIENIWLETDNGKISPIARNLIIRDFPKDEPLKWRVKLIAKFPYKNERNKHNLILKYNDSIYNLTNIKY